MTAQLPSRRIALAGAFATLALAGCSSTKKSDTSDDSDASTRLTAAQDVMAKTAGYHVKLTSSGTPDQESSLKSGEGDVVNSPQSFKGTVTANTGGSDVKAEVISIEKESWVKPGFSSKYIAVNLDDMGVPLPSSLFNASKGLPALPVLSKDMKKTGEKLVGGEKVTLFKGTVDGPTATKAMGFGRTRKNYTVEVGLNDKNEMRSMSINGSFFDSSDATYNLEMSKFGQKATISKPA